jgi:hypothetical protein
MNDVFNKLMKNGWCPVPYKHHPKHIKESIKAANFRPQAKQCFANSQRIVMQNLHKLRYAEGIVVTSIGLPITHAWVVDENDVHYDITLSSMPQIMCYKIYEKVDVLTNIISKNKYFTPINQEWLNVVHMAVLYNIKVDDLSIEQIKDEVAKTLEKLMCKS